MIIAIKILSAVCAVLLSAVAIQTLRIVFLTKKVNQQELREQLLTEIIEERCVPYGDDTFDKRGFRQGGGSYPNAEG